jgi:dihydroorotate dehydrogenase (fumarate)
MDLATRYMGLQLKNPLVASASPLTGELGSLRQIEDAGAAAVVLPSLFQEEIEAETARYDHLTSAHNDSWPEGLSNFPILSSTQHGPHQYLELVRRATEALEVPVIASLNGISNEGWTSYAKQIEQAGADGLELNIYFIASDFGATGEDVERRYLDILRTVRTAISIPLAIKLSPYFSSAGNMAPKASASRRRRSGTFQPVLSARSQSGALAGTYRPPAQRSQRDSPALALARHSCRSNQGFSCRKLWGCRHR